MSKYYNVINEIELETITTAEMRKHSQRPGKTNPDGSIQYFTEQAHQKETDINQIIKKYDKTGLIDHVSRFEAIYGEHTGIDYKTAQDLIIGAKLQFNKLPTEIKKRFKQTPEHLLTFMEDPNNREEAIKLGLINSDWTPETDGLGEHIKLGDNIKKQDLDPEKKE